MTNQLIALLDGREIATVDHKNARLSFVYNDAWRADPNAYPNTTGFLRIGAGAFRFHQRMSFG
jgi:hypothetical protein